MRFGNQTDTITCLGGQGQMFDFDSADTDFVLVFSMTDTIHEINDRADSKVLGLESHKPIGSRVSDWAEITDPLREQTIKQLLGLSSTKLWVWETVSELPQIPGYGFVYLPQAQSDLVITEEKEKQSNRTDTAGVDEALQTNITEKVKNIFMTIAEEPLENEIEDEFAKSLSELIGKYEGNAVNEIQHFILKEEITPELAEATLRILGDLEHTLTHNYRRWLLEKALIEGSSPIVRDGANVGLAYMDDPHAIPFFKNAIQKERNFLLRKVMNKTLFQLEDKQKCQSSCTVQSLTNG